jgi:post-segregation antitoxin (ccd killing protein)
MEVYDTSTLVYSTSNSSINASVNLAPGGHELTIQGSDAHGNWFKNVVNVVVQQSGSVTMTSPQNNQDVFSPVTVAGQATSAQSITAMQVYEDNKLVYNTTASAVNTSLSMTPGNHVVVLQAFDAAGNVFKNSATITVAEPVSASTVAVVSPSTNATVTSPVSIVASAVAPTKITAMQVYEDNNLVYQTAGASLNTSLAMSAGTHKLAIKAWDATGENSLALRTITVK